MIIESAERSVYLDTTYQGNWYCYTCNAYIDSLYEHEQHNVSKCIEIPSKECC